MLPRQDFSFSFRITFFLGWSEAQTYQVIHYIRQMIAILSFYTTFAALLHYCQFKIHKNVIERMSPRVQVLRSDSSVWSSEVWPDFQMLPCSEFFNNHMFIMQCIVLKIIIFLKYAMVPFCYLHSHSDHINEINRYRNRYALHKGNPQLVLRWCPHSQWFACVWSEFMGLCAMQNTCEMLFSVRLDAGIN